MEYIPYGKQYIDQDDIDAVVEVLKSDWLTQGPRIKEFESMVASYHKCKYAVAFCNGTAALHGAYFVSTKFSFGKSGNNQYWEFITSPITFVASANGGLYCGGSPKFVDIDINTYCIDIESIEDKINDDTRVITPVSYAGYPVDIKAIRELPKVKENNVCIIHDACHAIGARRNGYGIADYADMTILSFHPVKHITTGEGGMVLTNNKDYYEMLLMFRNHGITKEEEAFIEEPSGPWHYEMQQLGYNYRITDIQCALGISQMKKLDGFLLKRNQIAKIYEDELKNTEWIKTPPGFEIIGGMNGNQFKEIPEYLHSYHLYPVLLGKQLERNKFFDYMHENKIGVQVHYIPVESQIYYKRNFNMKDSHKAKDLSQRIISLPIFPSLEEGQIEYILRTIKNYS